MLAFLHLVIFRIIRHLVKFPAPAFATRLIDNPFRRRFVQNPETIADRMQLKPGMVVVEIGPGKGSYTKAIAARLVPGGKVYAVDIQETVIANLQHRIEREGIPNIVAQIDDAYNFSFADSGIDRVFANACLPEIPDPVRVLRECKRILKPGGLVCLCELFPDPDYPMRRTEISWGREAGLNLQQQFGNWFTYQLHFVKSAG